MSNTGVTRFSLASLGGLALCACLASTGCTSETTSEPDIRISWTGAPKNIERMISAYVQGESEGRARRRLLPPQFYAKPTPFFLYEGNDDAVTLALSARLGTSDPPIDVFYIDLYWFQDFEH